MDEKPASHVVHVEDELRKNSTVVKEANVASAALAAAHAAKKPSLLSRNMLKLYFIMGIGYLVSTMNGFGKASAVVTVELILIT